MAEGGEEIVHQELRRERADHAETREEAKRLRAVVEAARDVVASTRGDISRKPFIGRLRAALDALDDKPKPG